MSIKKTTHFAATALTEIRSNMSAARPVRATAAVTTTATSPRDLRRRHAPYAAAQGRALRDRHHRAVSPPGKQRGGGPHRDVPGGRFRTPRGGHHRGIVGQQGLARHHQRTEQECLRSHRGSAQAPVTGRTLSVCLRGRYLAAP